MAIHAVIWDMGNVINRKVDERPRLQLARRLKVPLVKVYQQVFDCPTALPAALGQITVEQHWQAVGAAFNLTPEELVDFRRDFWAADEVDSALVAYIRSLRSRYTVALLSNAWDDLRRVIEEEWRIGDLFDDLVISAEVGLAKPDPRIYHLALSRLSLEPAQTVFLDDVAENVEAARSLGMYAIQYQDFLQARQELDALLAGAQAGRSI